VAEERAERIAIDVELVVAARSGSANAFGVLVDRHYEEVATYLWRLLGDQERAAELTQETFLAAYRDLHQLSGEHSFAAWLYRLAHHRAKRELHRRSLLRFVALDQVAEVVGGWLGKQPHDELEALPTRYAVQAALDCLPTGEREALLLHSLAGLKTHEVAHVLGISRDAAGRRISRGAERFRGLYRATAGPTEGGGNGRA
jgi:RNA polymerase sigma-70 factor (ECF subfamily)